MNAFDKFVQDRLATHNGTPEEIELTRTIYESALSAVRAGRGKYGDEIDLSCEIGPDAAFVACCVQKNAARYEIKTNIPSRFLWEKIAPIVAAEIA